MEFIMKSKKMAHIKILKKVNKFNFDRDGFYQELQPDGTYHSTKQLIDPEGYDRNGLDKNGFNRQGDYMNIPNQKCNIYNFRKDGTNEDTGLTYDKKKFQINGINIITKTMSDIRNFDRDGNYNGMLVPKFEEKYGRKYDYYGFKQDGTYMETGKKYDEQGLNAFRVDINGKNEEGEEHKYITFSKLYINGILSLEKNNPDIIAAKEYIKLIMEKNKESQKIMQRTSDDYIRIILYEAQEMYPAIKEELIQKVEQMQEEIRQREETLQELQQCTKGKKGKIKQLEKEIEQLRNGLENFLEY